MGGLHGNFATGHSLWIASVEKVSGVDSDYRDYDCAGRGLERYSDRARSVRVQRTRTGIAFSEVRISTNADVVDRDGVTPVLVSVTVPVPLWPSFTSPMLMLDSFSLAFGSITVPDRLTIAGLLGRL